jgi:hypothetical protein
LPQYVVTAAPVQANRAPLKRAQTSSGKHEYIVPEQFNDKFPAFRYSHVDFDQDIESHLVAAQLPKPTPQPSLWKIPPDLHTLIHRADRPVKFSEYVDQNLPPLGLHIVSFRNATLVSISWPHSLADGMGMSSLLHAWSLVVQEKEDQVPPLLGVDFDPLERLGGNAKEPYKLANRFLGKYGSIRLIFRTLLKIILFRDEERVVCIPADFVLRLRREALDELAAGTKTHDGTPPFVSEGDVLCAWLSRLALSRCSSGSDKTVGMHNALDMRPLLAQDPCLLPANGAYVANAVSSISTFTTVRDVLQKPLSHSALLVRRSIIELSTRDQVEAQMAINKQIMQDGKRGLDKLVGDANSRMIAFSNWSKGKFFSLDFSNAVVKTTPNSSKSPTSSASGKDGPRPLGIPSYVVNQLTCSAIPMRDVFIIVGKDAAGNYWSRVRLEKRDWKHVEQRMRGLA